jgi:hypothetical protein
MDSSILLVNDVTSVSDLVSCLPSLIFSFILVTPCQSNECKRRSRDTELWFHSREPRADELSSHKNRTPFYCKYCIDSTHQDLLNALFRNHPLKQHNINVPLPQDESSRYTTPISGQHAVACQPTIQSCFSNVPCFKARVTILCNDEVSREHLNHNTTSFDYSYRKAQPSFYYSPMASVSWFPRSC